jgi:prepilin-type N-terminal cleavage/methylation domain-containing protein
VGPDPTLNRRLRLRAGFSLIEILIVMIMVGALLSVALPRVSRTMQRDRVLRSALVVQSMIEEATQLSTRLRVPVDVDWTGGRLVVSNRATGAELRSRPFGEGQDLRATVTMSPVAGITIFPTGRADAALTITLSGGDYTTTVSRTSAGIVRRQ